MAANRWANSSVKMMYPMILFQAEFPFGPFNGCILDSCELGVVIHSFPARPLCDHQPSSCILRAIEGM